MTLLRPDGMEAASTKIILPNCKPALKPSSWAGPWGRLCGGTSWGQSFPAVVTGPSTLPVRGLTNSRCPSLACPSAFPVSSTLFFLLASWWVLSPLPRMPPPAWWSLAWPPSHMSCFCTGGLGWRGPLEPAYSDFCAGVATYCL